MHFARSTSTFLALPIYDRIDTDEITYLALASGGSDNLFAFTKSRWLRSVATSRGELITSDWRQSSSGGFDRAPFQSVRSLHLNIPQSNLMFVILEGIRLSATVAQVYEAAASAASMPVSPHQMNAFYYRHSSAPLSLRATLGELGVGSGSSLEFRFRIRGGGMLKGLIPVYRGTDLLSVYGWQLHGAN